MEKQIEKFRGWQKENPDWELICDMDTSDHLYVQWNELSKAERMSWIGRFRDGAKEAYEEFAMKLCKVECKCLTDDLNLVDILDWPSGLNMIVYRTAIDGTKII